MIMCNVEMVVHRDGPTEKSAVWSVSASLSSLIVLVSNSQLFTVLIHFIVGLACLFMALRI